MRSWRTLEATLALVALSSQSAFAATIDGAAVPSAVVWLSPVAAHVPAAPSTPQLTEIRNIDRSFDPALLILPVGSSVRFSNEDPFFHSIFSSSEPDAFDIGFYSIGPGKTVSFPRAGIITVRCHIHRAMRAVIIVVDGPAARADARSGAFRLTGVASGSYVIHAWDPGDATERRAPLVVAHDADNVTLTQALRP